MSLEKRKVFIRLEVQANGVIFIKELNQILDEGVVISSTPHRSSVTPLDDVSGSEYEQLKTVAAALWTTDLISEYVKSQTNTIEG